MQTEYILLNELYGAMINKFSERIYAWLLDEKSLNYKISDV